MLMFFKAYVTASIIWPLKTSIINKAVLFWSSKLFLCSFKYGKITSLINLSDSFVLLQCFSFVLSEKDEGKSNFGYVAAVLPPYINYIGKKWFENVIPNLAIGAFRYDNPEIATVLTFFCQVFDYLMVHIFKWCLVKIHD